MPTLPIGDTIALKIAVQTGPADADDVSRAQAIPLAHLKYTLDVDLANFFE